MLIGKVGQGVLRGLKHRRPIRGGVRILVYHGVIEQRRDSRVEESFHLLADFRAHLELFRRRCHVVPLDELDAALAERTLLPRVAITFDDGFANNVLAAELLVEHGLPATVFVASENVERGETIWPTLLRLVLARGSARRLRLDGITYSLDEDPRAFGVIRDHFKQLPTARRQVLWDELVDQLGDGELAALAAAFPSLSMMSWSDVRDIQHAGLAIGSHGCLHELQHVRQPGDLRTRELAGSRAQIEAATGRPCLHFAYPNGTFHARSATEVSGAGYARAFTMVPATATRDDHPLLIPRLGAPAPMDKLILTLMFGS